MARCAQMNAAKYDKLGVVVQIATKSNRSSNTCTVKGKCFPESVCERVEICSTLKGPPAE